jgi:hypothetical protein
MPAQGANAALDRHNTELTFRALYIVLTVASTSEFAILGTGTSPKVRGKALVYGVVFLLFTNRNRCKKTTSSFANWGNGGAKSGPSLRRPSRSRRSFWAGLRRRLFAFY